MQCGEETPTLASGRNGTIGPARSTRVPREQGKPMHDPLSAPPDPLLSPRKSRRGLLAIVLAVVLVLGAGAWWYFTRTPEGTTVDGQAKGDASKGDARKGAGKGGRGNFA